ncbi:hypothetical protein [Pseudomonas sp. NPDC089547]|uniref:hypothetical protein n=1 Tax=Pseudomonas sp. NPDC089547 TaxID=3390652 RepID=UPI003D03310C
MQPHDITQAEAEKIRVEVAKLHVEVDKLMADTRKAHAEPIRMTREIFWYPVAIAAGIVTTVATVTAVIIKLLT